MDAVFTTCAGSPCSSRMGTKVRMPWITPQTLTFRIHS